MFLLSYKNGINKLYGSYIGNSAELEVSPIFWNYKIHHLKISSINLTYLDEQYIFWNIHDIIDENIQFNSNCGLKPLIILSTFKYQFGIEAITTKLAQLFDKKIWCDDESKLLFNELNDGFYMDQCGTVNRADAEIYLINENKFTENVCIMFFFFF